MFVRELDTLGIAYHSPALNPFADKLRRVLHAVVPSPKERSARWLSTSFPLDSEDAGPRPAAPTTTCARGRCLFWHPLQVLASALGSLRRICCLPMCCLQILCQRMLLG